MFIRLAVVLATFILAGFFVYLGMEHMSGTLGLTPWAAFPFALGCVFAPAAMYERELEELECDIDSLEGQCDNLICELYAHSESERVEPCTCEEPHCSPCPQPYQEGYMEWYKDNVSDPRYEPYAEDSVSPYHDEPYA
jgi:hypothetical protein